MQSYAEKMLDELDGGQLEAAKKSFALSLRHDDDETIHSLAEELYALGFSTNAKRAYQKLLDKYPDEDVLRTELAEISISEDQSDEALAYLIPIQSDSEAYLEALLVYADLYQSEGLLEAAENKLTEAYQLAPDELVIQFALAEFLFELGRYSEAIPFYRNLIVQGETQISGIDLVSRIGVAYAMLGDQNRALGYLEQIKDANLTPEVRFQLGMLYANDEETRDQGIEAFEKLIEIDPSYAGVYVPLGQLYEQKQMPKDALGIYEAGLAVDQFNEAGYLNATRVAIQLNENDQAEQLYQKGLKNLPDSQNLISNYSQMLVDTEQYMEQINFLNQYVSADDEFELDPKEYWNLAQSYTELERYEMADQYWQAAVPFFNENSIFLKEAIYYFREAGNHEMLSDLLNKYVQLNPEDFEMAQMESEINDL
ncbi:hypothetical protein WKK_00355 [Weissella koreensis KACC 15510]|uniref:tetratricopeptide repeat protein n=1 Tax=Weissella koreensis TaxID=165096 RepID=UPI0002175892|nr:tetratricopeptide repeat protein [Weissella koreensis]AEJ22947.1 hypothetical protein WKK_00355 [Weissella koreensis KACC 15510]